MPMEVCRQASTGCGMGGMKTKGTGGTSSQGVRGIGGI